MITITTKKLIVEENLKKKLAIIFSFCNLKPKYINGSIKGINRTNLPYIESRRAIVKDITILVFNYLEEVYINSLYTKVKITELEGYLRKN